MVTVNWLVGFAFVIAVWALFEWLDRRTRRRTASPPPEFAFKEMQWPRMPPLSSAGVREPRRPRPPTHQGHATPEIDLPG